MRNKNLFSRLCFPLFFGILFIASAGLAEKLVIQDYSVKVRKAPSLTGPSVGELKHNDVVEEVERRNNLVKIKFKDFEGWIPLSALITQKKLKIKKGKRIDAGTPQDVLAAGKGLGDTSEEISDSKSDAAWGQKLLEGVEAETETKESAIEKFKANGGLKPGQKPKRQ
ncbi:MAG: SH3 domain-containing protein [bacterium]